MRLQKFLGETATQRGMLPARAVTRLCWVLDRQRRRTHVSSGGGLRRRFLSDAERKPGSFENRILGGLTKSVRKPWHIYPIGVLFGLGFDTATEVGLLGLSAAAASGSTGSGAQLPPLAIIALPIIFAAGMSLMDTFDGVFMARSWRVRRREFAARRHHRMLCGPRRWRLLRRGP